MNRGVSRDVLDVLQVGAASEHDREAGVLWSSKRIEGRPALSRSGLKCRLILFWVSRGVPFPVANTSPESS